MHPGSSQVTVSNEYLTHVLSLPITHREVVSLTGVQAGGIRVANLSSLTGKLPVSLTGISRATRKVRNPRWNARHRSLKFNPNYFKNCWDLATFSCHMPVLLPWVIPLKVRHRDWILLSFISHLIFHWNGYNQLSGIYIVCWRNPLGFAIVSKYWICDFTHTKYLFFIFLNQCMETLLSVH